MQYCDVFWSLISKRFVRESVDVAMRGVDYVFAAAALKQVPSCEFFPMAS